MPLDLSLAFACLPKPQDHPNESQFETCLDPHILRQDRARDRTLELLEDVSN